MFYPEAMTEIQLIVPEKDLIAATQTLASQKNFYQVDANYMSESAEFNAVNSWKEKETAYLALERRIGNLLATLGIQEQDFPPAGPAVELIESAAVGPQLDPVEQEVNAISSRLAGDQKKLEQLRAFLQQLEPVAQVDFELSDLNDTHYIFSILGVMPAANIERLETSLTRVPFVLLVLSQTGPNAVVWLAGTRRRAGILERAARSAYLNPLKLPEDQRGTPAQVIAGLRRDLEQTERSIQAHTDGLAGLNKAHAAGLQSLLWRVRAGRMLADAIARFGQLQYTYIIVGWTPTASLAALTGRLKQVSPEIVLDAFPSKRIEARQAVPVVLHNPRLLGPFQQLVTTLAHPRYEEIDPTFLMGLTFPLLFGAMFGDVGHGLLLALLGVLLRSRKLKALRSMAGLGGLVIACGLAATVFGFVYGSIFGLENILPALWIRPMDNITTILLVAVGAGVVLLSLGFLLNLINAGLARDWADLFFDHNGLAGFLLYWSLIGVLAASLLKNLHLPILPFLSVVALSGLAIMFSEILKNLVHGHRPLIEGGIGTYIIQAFFELFETLIGFLSNTLSYVRVGAFAVAHVGLSAVIFIIAGLIDPSHTVGYWIVVALGTLVIVGFEGLIVGIQTMRLQYYEFFGKFFRGGGTRREPLALSPAAEKS